MDGGNPQIQLVFLMLELDLLFLVENHRETCIKAKAVLQQPFLARMNLETESNTSS